MSTTMPCDVETALGIIIGQDKPAQAAPLTAVEVERALRIMTAILQDSAVSRAAVGAAGALVFRVEDIQ